MTELVAAYMRKDTHLWKNITKFFVFFTIFWATSIFAAYGAHLAVSSQKEISAKIATGGEVRPREKIAIVFSEPVDPSSVEKSLLISPETKINSSWSEKNQQLNLKPVSHFLPGEKYKIELKVKEGLLKNKEKKISLSFQVEDFPKVVNVDPGKEEASISVDSEFKISFDKPTNDYDINFVIDPFRGFDFEANGDRTEFRIISKDKLRYETEYKMRITARVAGEENEADLPEEIFYGTFVTEKKPVSIPVKSSSAIIPENEVVDHEARISEGKYIDINLTKQHLSIFLDGERKGTFRISSGKRGMATPTGNFKIMAKRGRAWSKKYKLYMPFFMQFTGAGHGIHELPEWPGGYKEGAAHLGIPVSHGCVRLGIGPAETVYNFSEVGTPMVVHY